MTPAVHAMCAPCRVFWDYDAGAWVISCLACGAGPKLVSNGMYGLRSFEIKLVLLNVAERHNRERRHSNDESKQSHGRNNDHSC